MPRPSNVRKRQLPGVLLRYKCTWESPGFINERESFSLDVKGRQMTVSVGNDWPAPTGAKLVDRGGPFYTTKSYLASPRVPPYVILEKDSGYGFNEKFVGTLLPFAPGLTSPTWDTLFPPTLESTSDALDEKGATAISRCKPTNSVANLGQTLAETMREGIPALVGASLLKSKTKSLLGKGAGEFLNVSFGWMPLVSDVKKASKAIVRSDQILAQYERDAGNVVRRKYYFPLEKTVTEDEVFPNQVPYGMGTFFFLGTGLGGRVVRRRVVERKTWFSGAFTYYLPSDYDSRNKVKELRIKADLLLGTDLTPELLWNVGPWSWLVDWFANTGDVISNLTDFGTHELIMRYGYVMETVKVSDTYTHYPTGPSPWKDSVTPLTFVTETKIRRPANPFGFGLSWEGLSSFQQAILAALGITRATR